MLHSDREKAPDWGPFLVRRWWFYFFWVFAAGLAAGFFVVFLVGVFLVWAMAGSFVKTGGIAGMGVLMRTYPFSNALAGL